MAQFFMCFYDMMEKIVFVRRGCLVWMNGCKHCRRKWKKNRLCAGSGTVWKWNIEAFAAMKGNWRCCGRKNWKMWRGWNRAVYGTSLRKSQANMEKHWRRSRQKLLRLRQNIRRYSRKLRKWRILCGSWINASAN